MRALSYLPHVPPRVRMRASSLVGWLSSSGAACVYTTSASAAAAAAAEKLWEPERVLGQAHPAEYRWPGDARICLSCVRSSFENKKGTRFALPFFLRLTAFSTRARHLRLGNLFARERCCCCYCCCHLRHKSPAT